MVRFVWRKMLNKKWMILSLLLGNLFLISIAMSGPMYIDAVTQNLLTEDLADQLRSTGSHPAVFSLEMTLNSGKREGSAWEKYCDAALEMAAIPEETDTPVYAVTELSRVEDITVFPAVSREDTGSSRVSLAKLTGLKDHIVLTEGTVFSDVPDDRGVYDVLIGRTALIRKHFYPGEELIIRDIPAPDGGPLTVRIAGVFEEDGSLWWTTGENEMVLELFLPETVFDRLFLEGDTASHVLSTVWSVLLDHTRMKTGNVDRSIALIDRLTEKYNKVFLTPFHASCETVLRAWRTEANRASATLKVLQVPVFALLITLIFTVSRQILQIEQSEISVLKSRGASGVQILRIYLSQSLWIAGGALLLSIPLSVFLCTVIGSAGTFLTFSATTELHVRFTAEVLLYALAAVLVGIGTMALPAVSISRMTIVDAKRGRHAIGKKPVWQRFWLDGICLAVSLYGLYTFGNQKELLASRVAAGGALDPLLYISSSLFILGGALLTVRLIPLLASLVYRLIRKTCGPATYASYLQILRSGNEQAFMVAFLILTVAIGVLNADTACTVDRSREEQLRYDLGADIVLGEAWIRVDGQYVEPDPGRYGQLDHVESTTRVYRDTSAAAEAGGRSLTGVMLMGIETKDFGNTAWIRDGLSEEHFFSQLNRIAGTLNGCLVSSGFRDTLGMKEGDKVSVRSGSSGTSELRICGFVDFFPSWNSTYWAQEEDGTLRETDRYLVVANLACLRSAWGVQPYEIWIRTDGEDEAVREYALSGGIRYRKYEDIFSDLSEMRSSPAIQGTNGVLTLSFMIGLTVCAVGFMIFWILSIRGRTLQFGIYRAMGMTDRETVRMLINEQVWQSLTAILAGGGIGYLAGRLYIPLIQISYSTAEASLPLSISSDITDYIRLGCIVFAVIVACVYILIGIVRRLNVAEAIRLGED